MILRKKAGNIKITLFYISDLIEIWFCDLGSARRVEINLLENFQTKILSLHGHNINMESLDLRIINNDLCWYYSILHNYTHFDAINFF